MRRMTGFPSLRLGLPIPLLVALLSAFALAGCGAAAGDPVQGEALYRQETIGERGAPGCTTCHSLEPGEVKVGPSHAGVGARAAERVRSPEYAGEATDAAGYLRESILDPDADVVGGFDPGVMYGKYEEVLRESQVDDLVAFLLTLQSD